MNRRKLIRWLTEHECRMDHHGGEHDIWTRPGAPRIAPVPRHREVKAEIVRDICQRLGIPRPREK